MNGIYKNYSVCNNSIQNYNFCEYLSLIANNEIKCIKNLALLQCYAFPEDGVPVSENNIEAMPVLPDFNKIFLLVYDRTSFYELIKSY